MRTRRLGRAPAPGRPSALGRLSTAACLSALACVWALALPAGADAHGLVGRTDLPVPKYLFGWGASVVLIVSFVALGLLWREPRLEHPPLRRLMVMPAWLEPACGGVGVLLFLGLVYCGLAGVQSPAETRSPPRSTCSSG